MPVKLQPGKVYWVGVNSPQQQQFKSADGTPARPYQILFATRSADGKPTPLAEELVKQAKIINTGFIPSLSAELKNNSVLDLDTGKVMPLEKDWPQTHELAWDNDMGGALMIAPNSKARILALPEATEMNDALLRKVIEPYMQALLALSQERGMPAKRARFAAVLTSEGRLAVVEIVAFTPQQAQLHWVVGEVAAYQNRLGQPATQPATGPATAEREAEARRIREQIRTLEEAVENQKAYHKTEKHPNIIELRKRIAQLKGRLDDLSAALPAASPAAHPQSQPTGRPPTQPVGKEVVIPDADTRGKGVVLDLARGVDLTGVLPLRRRVSSLGAMRRRTRRMTAHQGYG